MNVNLLYELTVSSEYLQSEILSIGDNDFPWWKNLPVPTDAEKPQPTATAEDFEAGLSVLESKRDRAVLSV